MKIAYVCPFYTPAIGGVKQVVEELAERLVKEGHDVHVFTCDSDKNKRIWKKNEVINGVKVHRCPYWFKVANFAYVWPSVYQKLKKENSFGKFDVIHTHIFGHLHVFLAALFAKLNNIKHVNTPHCPWTDANRSLLGTILYNYNFISNLAFKWADNITAITPWEIEFIKKRGGKESKITVIPNGMDNMFYQKIKPNNFRKELGILENHKLVLFFGRLSVTKAPDLLAQVGKQIVAERDNVHFVFLGPDEGKKQAVKEIIQGVDRMYLLEPIRNNKKKIAEMYQAADIYALPSFREGLPLTLFEAMASGLPIVTTPVNGIPYEVKDKVNGLIVPYGDLNKLKKAIEKFLDDDKFSKEISKNNLKKAENYTWDSILEKMKAIYEA